MKTAICRASGAPVRASFIIFSILVLSTGLWAGGAAESDGNSYSIGVFIPGQIEGSPTYEMLAEGVNQAADDARAQGRDILVKYLEAGFNQAEWGEKLQGLVATGEYDLIVSSNPSIPDLIRSIAPAFPDQKFLVMDAENPGISSLSAVMLNQYEQAFLSGYFAGLVTTSRELSGANPERKLGMIVGQEYPVMNDHIRPGFADGAAEAAGSPVEIDFRVLGNWYDAEKARELADSIYRQGADVILTIAGSGNQGVVSSAQGLGTYVLWYDSPGYSYGPGTVLGSSVVYLNILTRELVSQAIDGSLEYGDTIYSGIKEGTVDYARLNLEYLQNVPQGIRSRMDALIESVATGERVLGSDR